MGFFLNERCVRYGVLQSFMIGMNNERWIYPLGRMEIGVSLVFWGRLRCYFPAATGLDR